jgi:hypothetical protein
MSHSSLGSDKRIKVDPSLSLLLVQKRTSEMVIRSFCAKNGASNNNNTDDGSVIDFGYSYAGRFFAVRDDTQRLLFAHLFFLNFIITLNFIDTTPHVFLVTVIITKTADEQ